MWDDRGDPWPATAAPVLFCLIFNPSVKEFIVRRMRSASGFPRPTDTQSKLPPLERLAFHDCDVSFLHLSKILDYRPTKVLEFVCHNEPWPPIGSWTLSMAWVPIFARAKTHLKKLCFHRYWDAPPNQALDLRELELLTYLGIAPHLLFAIGPDKENFYEWTAAFLLLPPSIEVWDCRMLTEVERWEHVFEQILTHKSSQLPCLQKICLPFSDSDELVEMYSRLDLSGSLVGVDIELVSQRWFPEFFQPLEED